MSSSAIRKKFLEFFEKRGHAVVPSSSLVPDDPSVLLTTAGMQQFKKYYTGELDATHDFKSKNTVSIQKCFRTSDIDEVGDESHLTFFEMLGNFSFGGYFKKEAIQYAHEFITDVMKLEIAYVTVFDPGKVPAKDWRGSVPKDEESYHVWKNEVGLPEGKIRWEGVDNFWGPTGGEGPCGPTTEIYVKNAAGQEIEIWNIVFNEFYRDAHLTLTKLKTPGVDTGMGLERLAMVSQNVSNIFETDLFQDLVKDNIGNSLLPKDLPERTKRIILDHLRGIAFLISDGVRPSNKEAGYVLRRLMRRVIVHEQLAKDLAQDINTKAIFRFLCETYGDFYKNLDVQEISRVFDEEDRKFLVTLRKGLSELNKLDILNAKTAFKLYESYGLPYEIIKELGGVKASGLIREEFDEEFKKHQELSRAGAEKKFGGHGLILDTGELKAGSEEELEKVTRLHTATHLLHQALRDVLGNDVHQMGSDITVERTRFDFSFPRKLTPEEIQEVEKIVNKKIEEDLYVSYREMPKNEAEKTGALHFFKEKYPEKVKVYMISLKEGDLRHAYSKEFCGGPHVTHTKKIGTFHVLKEEAVGAGVRRIRGVVE